MSTGQDGVGWLTLGDSGNAKVMQRVNSRYLNDRPQYALALSLLCKSSNRSSLKEFFVSWTFNSPLLMAHLWE